VVGSSMGASVIWSYVELFGHQHLGKLVFVDQSPLQARGLAARPARRLARIEVGTEAAGRFAARPARRACVRVINGAWQPGVPQRGAASAPA